MVIYGYTRQKKGFKVWKNCLWNFEYTLIKSWARPWQKGHVIGFLCWFAAATRERTAAHEAVGARRGKKMVGGRLRWKQENKTKEKKHRKRRIDARSLWVDRAHATRPDESFWGAPPGFCFELQAKKTRWCRGACIGWKRNYYTRQFQWTTWGR